MTVIVAFGILIAVVAVITDFQTSFNIALGLASPFGTPGPYGAPSAGSFGIALAIVGYLVVPAVIGLVVSFVFDTVVRADVRRRIEAIESKESGG